MPADFLANDFEAIARAMQRGASTLAILHFWGLPALLSSAHENVESAVAEAYRLAASDTGTPVRITTPEGTVLMNTAALAEAVIRYREGTQV